MPGPPPDWAPWRGRDDTFADRFGGPTFDERFNGTGREAEALSQQQREALWHKRATEQAAELGPSASGRTNPVLSDQEITSLITETNPYGKSLKVLTAGFGAASRVKGHLGKSQAKETIQEAQPIHDQGTLETDLGAGDIGANAPEQPVLADSDQEDLSDALDEVWELADEEDAVQQLDEEAADEDEIAAVEETSIDEEALDNRAIQ